MTFFFLISTELIILGFLSKNKKIIYLAFIIGFFSRQTAVLYILPLIIIKFLFKKTFLNLKDILLIFILFITIFLLNDYHSNIASGSGKLSDHSGDIFGLIYFFLNDFDLRKLIIFFSYPFLSWLPLVLVFLLITSNLYAGEKSQIISQLNNLNSMEFTFEQLVNDKVEKGTCLLEFPGKLKCNYFDDKKKELIINNKKLAITQKRYNKTYHYPISRSPFLNILYKHKLLEIVQSGKLELTDQVIKLIYFDHNEIAVFFDKKSLDLKGWQIKDQYNNNINFSLNIVAKNDVFKKSTFKVPETN